MFLLSHLYFIVSCEVDKAWLWHSVQLDKKRKSSLEEMMGGFLWELGEEWGVDMIKIKWLQAWYFQVRNKERCCLKNYNELMLDLKLEFSMCIFNTILPYEGALNRGFLKKILKWDILNQNLNFT